jgi:enamine deaminase RidA (YjgF/YER057c/UK114 family)
MDIRLCAHGSASFARADAILLNGQNDRNSHPATSRRPAMPVTKIQPKMLFQRALEGRVLYTHVVVAETQSLIFISGQLARDQSGNIVGPRNMRAQIQQVGENLRVALEAAGATLENLVKTTTFVTDIDEFFRHVDVRHDYLGVGLPASTTVEVRRLSHPDLVVEIEAIAVKDQP